jgi:dihydrofolate synthase/folylpolyglutamate synthase
MNYPDSVEYLYSLGNESKAFKLGLEPVTILLNALQNPQDSFRSIHVAGTNGKGSTCAMIESGLRAAGMRTGLFTSPHLIEPTERIQINAQPISSEAFAAAFDEVHRIAEDLIANGKLEYHPTYFETVTAMAFVVFRRERVEAAVVEVGLGGRLDSTNVIHPQLCVITPVDYDHEAYLGSSIEQIAGEKAGILKGGVPAVFARQRPDVQRVLDEHVQRLNLTVKQFYSEVEDLQITPEGCTFTANGLERIPITCPLAGAHQVENAMTAANALRALGVPATGIEEGIRSTRWPGRLELVSRRPDIILDGAHNPAGARALAHHIRTFYSDREVWLVYGAMRDKAVSEISEILFPVAGRVILTAPSIARALQPEALLEITEGARMDVAPNPRAAVEMARMAPAGAAVFITGSLYLVGEARALLVQ